MQDKLLLTPAEAAELTGLSERQLYLASSRGELTAIKTAGRTGPRHYRRADLDAFINGCAVSGRVG